MLAWIGLGADGLSSSSYGPEEAFLYLGTHVHLALYLMVATVVTVFLISASYSQIIELFPTGGGGYLVGTKLLGPTAGIVSGSRARHRLRPDDRHLDGLGRGRHLLLPAPGVATPEAPGRVPRADLHHRAQPARREGVGAHPDPIFIAFMVSHVGLILYGIFHHSGALPSLLTDTVADTHRAIAEVGTLGMIAIFLRAFLDGRRHLHRHRGGQQRRPPSCGSRGSGPGSAPCSTWPRRSRSPPAASCSATC